MVEASSLGLADSLTDEERSLGLLYPKIERSTSCFVPVIVRRADTFLLNLSVREISAHIAKAVIRAAQNAVSRGWRNLGVLIFYPFCAYRMLIVLTTFAK